MLAEIGDDGSPLVFATNHPLQAYYLLRFSLLPRVGFIGLAGSALTANAVCVLFWGVA